MRLALIIVALAGMALGLVHMRRQVVVANHEIRQCDQEKIRLQRELTEQRVVQARQMAPDQVQTRAEQLGLKFENPYELNRESQPRDRTRVARGN